MMTYMVFIGGWDDGDPEWVISYKHGLTWEAARDSLAANLSAFEDDDCPNCRSDAAEALQQLKIAEPGKFESFVDGDDYMIMPE